MEYETEYDDDPCLVKRVKKGSNLLLAMNSHDDHTLLEFDLSVRFFRHE